MADPNAKSKWHEADDLIMRPAAFRLTRRDGSLETTFRIYGIGELIVIEHATGPLISIKRD